MNERYPKELERREKRVGALQEAFTNGVNTEGDLQRLQAQVGLGGGPGVRAGRDMSASKCVALPRGCGL